MLSHGLSMTCRMYTWPEICSVKTQWNIMLPEPDPVLTASEVGTQISRIAEPSAMVKSLI